MDLLVTVFTACANLGLGLIVFSKNHKSATNRLLALLTFIIAIWTISNYFSLNSATQDQTLFWIRAVMFFTAPFTPVLLFFLYAFPNTKLNINKKNIYFFILTIIAVAISSITPYAFSSVSIVNGVHPTSGIGLIPYGILTLACLIAGFWIIVKKYKTSTGLIKIQLKYLVFGAILTFTAMLITNFVFVVVFNFSDFVVFGPLFSLILVGFITYTIIKHRFLDIRLIIARMAAYLLLLFSLGFIYALSVFALGSLFFPQFFNKNYLLLSTILALFFSFTFQPLKKQYERFTADIFYRGHYKPQDLLTKLGKIMDSTLDLSELTNGLLNEIIADIKIQYGYLVLIKDSSVTYSKKVGIDHSNIFDHQEAAQLICKTLNDKETNGGENLLIFEEMEESDLKRVMRENDCGMMLPLVVDKCIIGAIILGQKSSGDIYSEEDINVLKIFVTEAAVAVKNALSYDEISRFNVTLEQEVAKKTKQLRDLTEQQKDQVDVMGHEVRTPLTAISQQLNLLLDMVLTSQKREEWLKGNVQSEDAKRVLDGLKKMQIAETQEESIVTNMIEAARIDKLRFELNYSTFDIVDLVKLAIKDSEGRLEINKQKGNIVFQSDLQKLDVEADQTRIKQCIDGLLTNAEKYGRDPQTQLLDVTVSVTKQDQMVSISVYDQGMGIAPQDMEKLGKKFSRLNPHENGSKLSRPGGTGLGLYTYKGIIERHGGQLIIASEGIGKGSTFTYTLPLVKQEQQQQSQAVHAA
ncbi:MAG TPA: ATP-binding protein [Patescibacteria group bacterium]|nr:ATP-binding protein [Patescibacteria group bacterium]